MPIQRLCDKCFRDAPEIRAVNVESLLDHFRLDRKDIEHIPTFTGFPLKSRAINDLLVREHPRRGQVLAAPLHVEEVARSKHGDECPASFQLHKYHYSFSDNLAKVVLYLSLL